MQIFSNTNIDFIKWRWHALALSIAIIVAGVVLIVQRGLPLGIDFSGGTIVVYKFSGNTIGEDQVRAAIAQVPGEKVVQRYGPAADNSILIRLPQAQGTEEGFGLEAGANALREAVTAANLGTFEEISREVVGPAIGEDLQRKGLWATLLSILGITGYIAVRFRLSFALGAIAATFHDILVTLAFLVFVGYDLSLNVIAALLTITGYSVNDTIVVFDRVRENLRSMRRDSLETVVNTSVNQTLARTIITAGTTFLSVLALYLFGGEVLEGFAFTVLVGIVSGTYSTIFIAAAVAIIMSRGAAAGGPGAAVAAPASQAGRAPVAGARKGTTRKAGAR
jgi:preprotein translocase subunit SecF